MAAKTDWDISADVGTIGNDLSKNNKSGFSAFPVGIRYSDGTFSQQNLGFKGGYWWSSTVETFGLDAYIGGLFFDQEILVRSHGNKSSGFSVRLIKDN
jgi:uncharacterized protein (TIGR02145 family)